MKITKVRFFEHGKPPPKNSRYKGTISSSTVGGYFDYTGREEAKDSEKVVEEQDDGYFGYTGSHTVGTYSSSGMLETKEDRNRFKKEIDKYFCNDGNLCWDFVISLEDDEEARKLKLETVENWASVMDDALPKIFRIYGLDCSNTIWWFDVHRNTEHPHIHLAFMEKHQTRTRGKITEKQLRNTKRCIYTAIAARKKLEESMGKDYREFFKDKDNAFDDLLTNIKDVDLNDIKSLKDLYMKLPKTGRLQYNSSNMKEFRPIIDRIVDEMIENDPNLKEKFEEYMRHVDILEDIMKEQGEDVSSIKEAELKKFHERVGNYILQNFKKNEYVYEEDKKENNDTSNKEDKTYKYESKKEKQERNKFYMKKYLTEARVKGYIESLALSQQNEIDKAIDEYNKRMEESLLVSGM